jgi:DNA-binding MarR family transcriptional regulator
MENIKEYIEEVFGGTVSFLPVHSNELGSHLPYYMIEMYSFYKINMMNQSLILFQPKQEDEISILQLSKHQELIENKLYCKSAVVVNEIESFQRKRLIEKRVQFIIPGKQMYLPFWLIDLNEKFGKKKQKKETISPSAQVLIIWYLLDKNDRFDFMHQSLKEIAVQFGYSAMTISKAVEELNAHHLCDIIEMGKEKFIRFMHNKQELWNLSEPLLVNPILKTVYTDEIPNPFHGIHAGFTALSEYTEMNPSRHVNYAIDKTIYYGLEKSGQLKNLNEKEGNYCLEVWKYDPTKFSEIVHTDEFTVDPISLYLSMKDNKDERTEYALENLINHLW